MSAALSSSAADLNFRPPVPLGESEDRASSVSPSGSKTPVEVSDEISIQDLQAKTALELVAEARSKLPDGRAAGLVATLVSSNSMYLYRVYKQTTSRFVSGSRASLRQPCRTHTPGIGTVCYRYSIK